MNALYGRTYLASLTECKESFKWDQRDFIYLSEIKETLFIQEKKKKKKRTWASFQRQSSLQLFSLTLGIVLFPTGV